MITRVIVCTPLGGQMYACPFGAKRVPDNKMADAGEVVAVPPTQHSEHDQFARMEHCYLAAKRYAQAKEDTGIYKSWRFTHYLRVRKYLRCQICDASF